MFLLSLVIVTVFGSAHANRNPGAQDHNDYAGSVSCRQCHERFYELWAPSRHGLAMQPYTDRFAEEDLTSQTADITISKYRYRARIEDGLGYVLENGPDGEKQYPIRHVMGGKNVYYFLTPLDRGRLQTLPVAYDVHRKQWFDAAASSVRHFLGSVGDEPVHWTDPLYTFNTSCYNCHVSQLSTNYDLKTDTYHTTWAEPGINCESCHGQGQEHIKICQAAGQGQKPIDLKIISTKSFTPKQTNSMCASCHAKMNSVSVSFKPGDHYFDHFDLVTLDHPDFYPDGRDLGENYTYTSWRMSPCVKSGKLDCMHCHTSSGGYRFKEPAKANGACLPCHQEQVATIAEHSHHEQKEKATQCISCHMPMTQFAHMIRTDHSMRPPTPAATLKYKSPNACNICHTDKDAAWAQKQVSEWDKATRQKQYLLLADYVDQARKENWQNLDQILTYIQGKDRDEVVAASLIRLLWSCDSDKKWAGIIKALNEDPSPLVRASAAEALDDYLTEQSLQPLLAATKDEYRLVRVRAAATLAGVPGEILSRENQTDLKRATAEFKAAMNARPDDYISHYNMGNFYMARGEYAAAISSFQTAVGLRPDFLPTHVNIAFAYNATGKNGEAERSFRKALALDPKSSEVHINLGMLLGEQSRLAEAETAFRRALELNLESALAAYNLGVLIAPIKPAEAVKWCQKAYQLRPNEPKYGYTYAFYLYQNNDSAAAVAILQNMVEKEIAYPDVYVFLGAIYQRQGQIAKARDVYQAAARNTKLSEANRMNFNIMINRLDNIGVDKIL